MNKFSFSFTGRQVNAKGYFHHCEKTVVAKNYDEAVLKLYDTHEHISGLRLLGVTPCEEEN